MRKFRTAAALALCLIGAVTAVLTGLVYALLSPVLRFLQIPEALLGDMGGYLRIIFAGLTATFLYNYFACLLRSAGNSAAPGFCAGKPGVFSAACSRENKYELSINNIEKALDFPPARV